MNPLNFQNLLEHTLGVPSEKITFPYSETAIKKLGKIGRYYSNLFQNLIYFRHNYFLIETYWEKTNHPLANNKNHPQKPEQDSLIRYALTHELRERLDLDFLDLNYSQVRDFPAIPLSVNLSGLSAGPGKKTKEEPRNAGNHLLQQNPALAEPFFLYCFDDFSSRTFIPLPFYRATASQSIAIHISSTDPVAVPLVKRQIFHHLYHEQAWWIQVPEKTGPLTAHFKNILRESSLQTDDPAGLLDAWQNKLKKSSFSQVFLLVDQFRRNEDRQFVQFLLEKRLDANLTFIYFGKDQPFPFNLAFYDTPVNHVRKLTGPIYSSKHKAKANRVNLNHEKQLLKNLQALSGILCEENLEIFFPRIDSRLIREKNWLRVDRNGLLTLKKSVLSAEPDISSGEKLVILEKAASKIKSPVLSLRICLEKKDVRKMETAFSTIFAGAMDFLPENGRIIQSLLVEHHDLFVRDKSLLTTVVNWLIRLFLLDTAKKILAFSKPVQKDLSSLKSAHIAWLEKDYGTLRKLIATLYPGKLARENQSEYYFLRFILAEKDGEKEQADQLVNKITGEYFLYLAGILLIDRDIYSGNWLKAEKAIARAGDFFRPLSDLYPKLELKSLSAKLLREQGQYPRAIQLYQNIFLQSEAHGFDLPAAGMAVDLGNVYWNQDDFSQAEFWYQKGLGLFQKKGNQNGEILAQSNLLEIQKITGNWDQISRKLHAILKFDRENHKGKALAVDLYNLGHLEFLKHDFKKAVKILSEAKAMFRKQRSPIHEFECDLLAAKNLLLGDRNTLDLAPLQAISSQLSRDQQLQLAILQTSAAKTSPRPGNLLPLIEQIGSRLTRFEWLSLLMIHFNFPDWLDTLRSLSTVLNKQEKNYYYYEYFYVYFGLISGWDEKNITMADHFYEMYIFFHNNKRRISARIQRLKQELDDRLFSENVFKSAELVNDSNQWQIPGDFFKSFMKEINARIGPDLAQIRIFEQGRQLYNFETSNEFASLREEILDDAIRGMRDSILSREEIAARFSSPERALYPYKKTAIIPWRISGQLMAVMLLCFKEKTMAIHPRDLPETLFLKNFSELFSQFYQKKIKTGRCPDFLIGESPQMTVLKNRILKVSQTDFPVLITGESGTGKELVAKAIHLTSGRSQKPFIPVNAAAIPETLMEAELFGYHKGAFTGAAENKMGLIEAANEGTLFLDEIAELPMNLQAKLLRLLQENEIRRLGETRAIQVNFRVLSATNRDVGRMIRDHQFREDLYFRLNVLQLSIPPLRDRSEDLPLLVDHIFRKNHFQFAEPWEMDSFLETLRPDPWPGNVRELESHIKRLITFYPETAPTPGPGEVSQHSLAGARDGFEKNYVLRALKENNWNKVLTARKLGISRVHLFNLINKFNLKKE